jgi:predicted porin
VGVASAQSSVTLSGRLDAGLVYTQKVAPGGSKANFTRGLNNFINFGVTEDLGGGMRALGTVNMRFEPGTGFAETSGGQARPLFQGETTVGVAGGFGTVRFGRATTALNTPNAGQADPWGTATVAASVYAPGYVVEYGAGGEGRVSNAIFYTSPSISGLTLSASFSPVKAARTGGFTKTPLSVNALYTAGPLTVGLGTENNVTNDKFTQLYGTYDLGVARLHFGVSKVEGGTLAERGGATTPMTLNALGSRVPTGGSSAIVAAGGEIDVINIGATIPMGANSFRVGYSRWNGDGSPTAKDDTKLGLGIRHSLSKRTDLYSNVAMQTRKNNVATANPATSNSRQQSFDLGVQHRF